MLRCPKCKTIIEPGTERCPNCGVKFATKPKVVKEEKRQLDRRWLKRNLSKKNQ